MGAIGFVGLGHMGHPMVMNLLKAGHRVTVFDLNEQAVQSLVTAGAAAANSPGAVTKNAEVVFTMLQTGAQVKACCLGRQGILQTIRRGALFIDSSSIDIEVTRELHQQAESLELAMVDAPVSGGVKGAEAATLTIMVGGSETNYQRATPYLSQLGKKIIHAGPAGCGQAAKICNNMILGISMIAVSEAFKLGEKLQLDPQKFFEISSQASGQCWAMTSYCPVPNILESVPANNNYQPGFSAAMMLKDLNLSQQAAKAVHADTPLGAKATALYQQFIEQGNVDIDFSAIINMLK